MNTQMLLKASENISIPTALIHTVVSMAIVFTVLILISFIISLLKFTNKIGNKSAKSNDKPATKNEQVEEKEEKVVAVEKAPETDNTELVAVISAAVAAYMEAETGVPVQSGGLVIRNIKKRTF